MVFKTEITWLRPVKANSEKPSTILTSILTIATALLLVVILLSCGQEASACEPRESPRETYSLSNQTFYQIQTIREIRILSLPFRDSLKAFEDSLCQHQKKIFEVWPEENLFFCQVLYHLLQAEQPLSGVAEEFLYRTTKDFVNLEGLLAQFTVLSAEELQARPSLRALQYFTQALEGGSGDFKSLLHATIWCLQHTDPISFQIGKAYFGSLTEIIFNKAALNESLTDQLLPRGVVTTTS